MTHPNNPKFLVGVLMRVVLPLIKKTCAKRKNKGINRKAYIVGRRNNLHSFASSDESVKVA